MMGQEELTAACQPMLARAVAEKGVDPDTLVLGDVLSMNVSTREGKLMERHTRRSRGQPVCGLVHLQTARPQGLADLEDVPRRPVGHGFNPNLSADVMARTMSGGSAESGCWDARPDAFPCGPP